MFEYLRAMAPLQQIILSVVFDDTREDGLREDVAMVVREADLRARLMRSDYGRHILERQAAEAAGSGAEASDSPQNRAETWLNEKLDQNVPVWHARPQMRGDFFIGLYRLRNTVFGITPSTKRKKILSRYTENMEALEAILNAAHAAEIDVLLYIAPVNIEHGQRPYVESEYAQFKSEVRALAERYSATFANLEDLIPERLWGKKDSTGITSAEETDFMHFTSAGHLVLADHLEALLKGGAHVGGM